MNKQLLITSDDFGMCHAVNAGIVRGMTQGMVASSNFLAPTPWFSEAVALAKEHRLEVGVHLCLTCDWDRLKWGPITSNPRLREADGSFPSLHVGLEKLGATDDDIYDELKAQVKLVKAAYGEPSHLDTHMIGGQWRGGIYDRVQKVIQRIAGEFGLVYTYECDPVTQKLKHFVAEDCQTQFSTEQIFEILGRWTGVGRYHMFGHAAEDTPELHSVCSPNHPARAWTGDCRVRDLAFYLNRENVERIKSMGFELIKVSALKS
jgi:predicted glycoside hydrolase/deacetylase ChbG (UPF0249 family)